MRLLFFLCLAGFAYAQPVFTLALDSSAEDGQRLLEARLAQDEIGVARVLDVGSTIRARGSDFMPLIITVLEASDPILEALEDDPRLAAMLPVSLTLFEQEGKTSISFNDHSQLMTFFDLTDETVQSLDSYFEALKASLSNLGELEPGEALELQEAPYLTASLPDEDLEGSMFFYTSIYEEQNMNLVGEIDLGAVKQAWLCNAGFAEKAFGVEPRLATIAPCRIFAYQDDTGIKIATLNSAYAQEAFPGILEDEDAAAAFEAINSTALTVFDEMGAAY